MKYIDALACMQKQAQDLATAPHRLDNPQWVGDSYSQFAKAKQNVRAGWRGFINNPLGVPNNDSGITNSIRRGASYVGKGLMHIDAARDWGARHIMDVVGSILYPSASGSPATRYRSNGKWYNYKDHKG